MYISKDYLIQKWKVLLGYIINVFLFRIMNVSCFYFPSFIFKIKFWIYEVHVGNIYFFLRIIHFQHRKNKDKYVPYYKAAVPGLNPAKASISKLAA